MIEPPKSRPIFWPLLFLTAFGLGAVLWMVWMSKVIRETREKRDIGFFVPMNTHPLPTLPTGGHSPGATNLPAPRDNSATSPMNK